MSGDEMSRELDQLLNNLETALENKAGQGDAIDRVLADAPRQTQVRSLRLAPEVVEFRRALSDGLIRVDTVNQVLRLINSVLTRF